MNNPTPAREAADRATPEGLMELADEMALTLVNSTGGREAVEAYLAAREKLKTALAGQAVQGQPVERLEVENLKAELADSNKAYGLLLKELHAVRNAPIGRLRLGIEKAANYLDEKRSNFDYEHSVVDWETGAREYGTGAKGNAAEEYSNTLTELADELRELAASTPPALPLPEPSPFEYFKAAAQALGFDVEQVHAGGLFKDAWIQAAWDSLAATPSPTGQAPSDWHKMDEIQPFGRWHVQRFGHGADHRDESTAAMFELWCDARRPAAQSLPAVPAEVSEPTQWTPSAENVNALPAPVRQYIHDLEARCDPAGLVRENAQLKDCNAGLQDMYRKSCAALVEVDECFRAAYIEGLSDRLAEGVSEPGSLVDLVQRRLLPAQHAVLFARKDENATPSVQPATEAVSEQRALITARAHIKWLAFGECRADGWEGSPPTAAEAVAAIDAALQSKGATQGSEKL